MGHLEGQPLTQVSTQLDPNGDLNFGELCCMFFSQQAIMKQGILSKPVVFCVFGEDDKDLPSMAMSPCQSPCLTPQSYNRGLTWW